MMMSGAFSLRLLFLSVSLSSLFRILRLCLSTSSHEVIRVLKQGVDAQIRKILHCIVMYNIEKYKFSFLL